MNEQTLNHQIASWTRLVLSYYQFHRQSRLQLSESQTTQEPFVNSAINSELFCNFSHDAKLTVPAYREDAARVPQDAREQDGRRGQRRVRPPTQGKGGTDRSADLLQETRGMGQHHLLLGRLNSAVAPAARLRALTVRHRD